MFHFKLAFRNLFKNKKRTIATIIPMMIGMFTLLIASGYINHSLWALKETSIMGGVGDFQLHKKGYIQFGQDSPYDYLMTNYKKIIQDLSKIPGVKIITPRLQFTGLISSSEKSGVIVGMGGLAKEEELLTTHAVLMSGKYLKDSEADGLVIGQGVAKSISLNTGAPCTIMTSMKDGGTNALDFNISGIVSMRVKDLEDVVCSG